MKRNIFESEHEAFRIAFRRFLEQHAVPNFFAWDRAGIVDREFFRRAGEAGFLGIQVPTEFGGGGVQDFRYSQVISEELQGLDLNSIGLGVTLHIDICIPYILSLGSEAQKARWLPGAVSGELISAIAMTESGAGSDLAAIQTTATRDGDTYIVNGAKTFITNGINSDFVIVACKTDASRRHDGISLLVIERGTPGFERGPALEKIGLHAQDTAELYFDDVQVPVANRLGEEGQGFSYMMENLAQERLSIATAGMGAARRALDLTVEYVKSRKAFDRSIGEFQNTEFRLAELATEVEVTQAFIDKCVLAINDDDLTAEEAAMAKMWCTELQCRAVDLGVQFHGGYGFMREFAIARAYADARVVRIYGGTNEIMRQIVGRALLGH
jgi:alkylation response protein AidB-like acyl-CoA dehydrogenase